jgi:hypothetical protein
VCENISLRFSGRKRSAQESNCWILWYACLVFPFFFKRVLLHWQSGLRFKIFLPKPPK